MMIILNEGFPVCTLPMSLKPAPHMPRLEMGVRAILGLGRFPPPKGLRFSSPFGSPFTNLFSTKQQNAGSCGTSHATQEPMPFLCWPSVALYNLESGKSILQYKSAKARALGMLMPAPQGALVHSTKVERADYLLRSVAASHTTCSTEALSLAPSAGSAAAHLPPLLPTIAIVPLPLPYPFPPPCTLPSVPLFSPPFTPTTLRHEGERGFTRYQRSEKRLGDNVWRVQTGSRPIGKDALEWKGPLRRPQKRLGRRLKEVANAIGGSFCRLQTKADTCRQEDSSWAQAGSLGRGTSPPLPVHPCPWGEGRGGWQG